MTHFSERYVQARELFRDRAAQAGARLVAYPVPDLSGIEGESLAVDVADLGDAAASRVGLVIAGTHGGEAYAASAIFSRWLDSPAVPTGVRLVLVHAVNPWSFSFKTRTTENHVDLNRNFLASWAGRENPAYRELAPYLHASPMDAPAMLRSFRAYRAHLDAHGWQLENQMLSGQAEMPQGLFYAGTGPEWANTNFRRIVRTHAAGAGRVGFIDFHTGVGEFGELVHLVFAAKGTEARQQAMLWWGLDDAEGAPFSAGSLPPFQGLLCQAISQELPASKVAGAVIEFGTNDAYGMFRADATDRWLRNEGRDHPAAPILRDQYRDACTPPDLPWRNLVLEAGPKAIDQLLAGLATWED